MMAAIAVACGGFIGALLRFWLSARFNRSGRPFGTLLVNWAGSFFIGVVIGAALTVNWKLFLATGLAGALTTYSTLMKEIWLFWAEGKKMRAVIYAAATFGIGIGLAYIGFKW